ncbi:hypothetical protein ACQR1W_20320 [Bradyrhizobium sp. HKCCYLS1011]|uniref:hypothetical protein n=1 Tax=Bradyrhizobium sp. HKCCYLS1011 TaxID=3420733 RepID=UPI003EC09687
MAAPAERITLDGELMKSNAGRASFCSLSCRFCRQVQDRRKNSPQEIAIVAGKVRIQATAISG